MNATVSSLSTRCRQSVRMFGFDVLAFNSSNRSLNTDSTIAFLSSSVSRSLSLRSRPCAERVKATMSTMTAARLELILMRHPKTGSRTVELTRRRDFTNASPDESSCETRSRRSRPTICSAATNQLTRYLASINNPPMYTILHSARPPLTRKWASVFSSIAYTFSACLRTTPSIWLPGIR